MKPAGRQCGSGGSPNQSTEEVYHMKRTNRTQDPWDQPYECPPPNRWDFAYLLPFIPGAIFLLAVWL